jgi:adenylate cyclase
VFELIGRRADVELVDRYTPILESYEHAMVLYHGQQFVAAAELFAQTARAGDNGLDAPSALYVERCRDLSLSPPDGTWDGVYVMKHK